jgi:hypothetical protein
LIGDQRRSRQGLTSRRTDRATHFVDDSLRRWAISLHVAMARSATRGGVSIPRSAAPTRVSLGRVPLVKSDNKPYCDFVMTLFKDYFRFPQTFFDYRPVMGSAGRSARRDGSFIGRIIPTRAARHRGRFATPTSQTDQ